MNYYTKVKILAWRWRYGLILPVLLTAITKIYIIAGLGFVFEGIYTIIIAKKGAAHFICGMQNIHHKPMWVNKYGMICSAKDRKTGMVIGIIFFVMGIALTILGAMQILYII